MKTPQEVILDFSENELAECRNDVEMHYLKLFTIGKSTLRPETPAGRLLAAIRRQERIASES
jgi:hypothetical protein